MRLYTSILLTISVIVLIAAFIFGYRMVENASPIKYMERGSRNYDLKKYEEAISDLNEYLVLEPNSIHRDKANFLIASSLEKTKNYRLAKDRFVNVINHADSNEYLVPAILGYANIARLENEVNYFIQPYLQRYLDHPTDKAIEYEMNMLYGYQKFFEKNYEDAISYFLRSNGELATLGLARVYFEQGQYEKAFDLYEAFIKYYATSQYYNEIVRTYKIQVAAYAFRLYELGEYGRARYYYGKLDVLFPRTDISENALFRIAHSYYIEKNYNEAIEYYKRVRLNNVELLDGEALLYLGIANFKLSNWQVAYKYLNDFTTEYAASPNASQARAYMEQIKNIYLMQ